MRIRIYHIIATIALSLLTVNEIFAQAQLPSDPPCGGPFDPCVPIDGGALFLLGAGIVYGSKKVLDHKKKAE